MGEVWAVRCRRMLGVVQSSCLQRSCLDRSFQQRRRSTQYLVTDSAQQLSTAHLFKLEGKGHSWAQSSRSAASAWRRRSTANCFARHVTSVATRSKSDFMRGPSLSWRAFVLLWIGSSQAPDVAWQVWWRGWLMADVVLVTGVSRYLGGRFARLLTAQPGVNRVIGVDVIPPLDDIGSAR